MTGKVVFSYFALTLNSTVLENQYSLNLKIKNIAIVCHMFITILIIWPINLYPIEICILRKIIHCWHNSFEALFYHKQRNFHPLFNLVQLFTRKIIGTFISKLIFICIYRRFTVTVMTLYQVFQHSI